MKHLYYLTIIIFVLALPLPTHAQSTEIKGTVTDVETQEPLPGVSVVIKGTIQGTVSDAEGRFAITTKQAPVTLTFSLVGFRAQEVEVLEGTDEDLPVQLTAGSVLGDGVVVT